MPRTTGNSNIRKMFARLEKAAEAYDAIPRRTIEDERRWERKSIAALRRADIIARRIVNTPAGSVEEMLLKIRATGWFAEGGLKKNWKPDILFASPMADSLIAIRSDLERLKSAA